MSVKHFAFILIVVHASCGGIALLAGVVALSSPKGQWWHRKAGKTFYITMLISALLALVISLLPGHVNPFLFAIGLFSAYLIVGGYRALRLQDNAPPAAFDRVLAVAMILIAFVMIGYPLLQNGKFNTVLTIFGVIGISLAARDLRMLRHRDELRKGWLVLHLTKMISGYIAATTAFVVVNRLIPGIYGWLTPTVLGTGLIVYWSRRIRGGYWPDVHP